MVWRELFKSLDSNPELPSQMQPDAVARFVVNLTQKTHALDLAICCPLWKPEENLWSLISIRKSETFLPAGLEDKIANLRRIMKESKY